jgi:hypothetical protein
MKEANMTYVLYIEFANNPPRFAVFDTLDEVGANLDAFEVSVFDPPQNDGMDRSILRARIFKCIDNWGAEIDAAIRNGAVR